MVACWVVWDLAIVTVVRVKLVVVVNLVETLLARMVRIADHKFMLGPSPF